MPLSDYVNFRTLGNYIIHLESNNHLTKKEGLDSCYVFCPPSSMANTTPSLPLLHLSYPSDPFSHIVNSNILL